MKKWSMFKLLIIGASTILGGSNLFGMDMSKMSSMPPCTDKCASGPICTDKVASQPICTDKTASQPISTD